MGEKSECIASGNLYEKYLPQTAKSQTMRMFRVEAYNRNNWTDPMEKEEKSYFAHL